MESWNLSDSYFPQVGEPLTVEELPLAEPWSMSLTITSYSNMLLEGLSAFLRANMHIWFILNHVLWNINRLTTKGQSLFLLTFKFFVIGFAYLGVTSSGRAVDEEIPPVHHGGVLSDRNQWEGQISRRCVMAVVISARSRTILETGVCACLWVDWGENICPL